MAADPWSAADAAHVSQYLPRGSRPQQRPAQNWGFGQSAPRPESYMSGMGPSYRDGGSWGSQRGCAGATQPLSGAGPLPHDSWGRGVAPSHIPQPAAGLPSRRDWSAQEYARREVSGAASYRSSEWQTGQAAGEPWVSREEQQWREAWSAQQQQQAYAQAQSDPYARAAFGGARDAQGRGPSEFHAPAWSQAPELGHSGGSRPAEPPPAAKAQQSSRPQGPLEQLQAYEEQLLGIEAEVAAVDAARAMQSMTNGQAHAAFAQLEAKLERLLCQGIDSVSAEGEAREEIRAFKKKLVSQVSKLQERVDAAFEKVKESSKRLQ